MSDTQTPMWTLGDRLAKARKVADLSVQEMATRLGVGRNTVTNYEQGHTAPSRAVVIAYASVTGVSTSWIEGKHTGRSTVIDTYHTELKSAA